jgi:hypothetical protein
MDGKIACFSSGAGIIRDIRKEILFSPHGFKKHWTKISTKNKKPGRKRIKKEIRDLIFRMAGENHWGAGSIQNC